MFQCEPKPEIFFTAMYSILATNFYIYKTRGRKHSPINNIVNLIIICNIPLGGFIFRINKAAQNLNCRLHDYNCILPMSAGKNITADSAQESQDKTIIQCHNRKWIKIQKNVNYTLLCIYTLKFYDNIFFLYFFFFSRHEKKQNSRILTILKDKTLNVLQQEIIGFGWRIFFEIVLLILPYI